MIFIKKKKKKSPFLTFSKNRTYPKYFLLTTYKIFLRYKLNYV